MKTTPITANSLQLTRFGLVNSYLLRESSPEGDSFTLIDTGLPGGAEDMIAAAQTAGAPIRRILLTHAHGDHVGSVDDLVARLGLGTQLAASARSLPLLQKPPNKALQPGEAQSEVKEAFPASSPCPLTS